MADVDTARSDELPRLRHVHITREGRIATAVIDRPPVNALSSDVLRELDSVVAWVERTAAIRCLVLTGAGPRFFVAGADIREAVETPPARAGLRTRLGQSLTRRLERLPIPVIAAVNGACLGGGCELAMSADIRLAASHARFGQPEIRLGIMPGFGGTQRLPRIVGRGRALELLLTGDTIDADEAYRIGLVNRVVQAGELMSTAAELAARLGEMPSVAVAAIKGAVDRGGGMPLDDGLDIELSASNAVRGSSDAVEGLRAFVEKRKPRFGSA
jgi:enoyl-CoA hydratase